MNFMRYGMRALIAAMIATAALLPTTAHCAPIIYAANLGTGGTAVGDANHAPGGAFSTPDAWTFFRFGAVINRTVDITVRRLDGRLDPVFGVWFGEETDTGNYFDMVSSSLNTSWIGFADDELPAALPGPGGDAALNFVPPGTGTYVVAVAGLSSTGGPLADSFAITISAIPEPPPLALLSVGLVAIVLVRRRGADSRPQVQPTPDGFSRE